MASWRTWALAMALAASGGGFGAGCRASKNPLCKRICTREARCVTAENNPHAKYDETECVAACTALERDHKGKKLVARHAACVQKAADCQAALACR